jgi:intergrase/recombinase
MARMNFDAKIEMLEAKIEKKTNDLKKLKEELEAVKERKMKTAYKELLEYMSENDITTDQVMEALTKPSSNSETSEETTNN